MYGITRALRRFPIITRQRKSRSASLPSGERGLKTPAIFRITERAIRGIKYTIIELFYSFVSVGWLLDRDLLNTNGNLLRMMSVTVFKKMSNTHEITETGT